VSRLVEVSKAAPATLALGLLIAVDDEALESLSSTDVLEALAGWERIVGLAAVEQAPAVRALSKDRRRTWP